MERVLITGVDRPLGANLALALAEWFEVLPAASAEVVVDNRPPVLLAAERPQGLAGALAELRPDWILDCGRLSLSSWDLPADPPAAECEPAWVEELARRAAERGIPLTWIGTDAVFRGPRLFHASDSPAAADGPWAALARDCEQRVLSHGGSVVRTHAYGWSPPGAAAGRVEQIYESLLQGVSWPADGLRHATPLWAGDLATLLVRARSQRLSGIWHLAGAERISPFGMAQVLAAVTQFRWPPGPRAEPAGASLLSGETSLDCSTARRALGIPMPLVRTGVEQFVARAAVGWRDRWRRTEPARAA
jgi:dTDP-4-dehydrorhamnose reductase